MKNEDQFCGPPPVSRLNLKVSIKTIPNIVPLFLIFPEANKIKSLPLLSITCRRCHHQNVHRENMFTGDLSHLIKTGDKTPSVSHLPPQAELSSINQAIVFGTIIINCLFTEALVHPYVWVYSYTPTAIGLIIYSKDVHVDVGPVCTKDA